MEHEPEFVSRYHPTNGGNISVSLFTFKYFVNFVCAFFEPAETVPRSQLVPFICLIVTNT